LETQPLTFVLVMTALALIGVVVFVIYLVVRNKEGLSVDTTSGSGPSSGQRWFEYLLAVLALVALVVAVIVVIVFLYPSGIAHETAWRGGTRSMIFLVAMMVVGLGALVAF
jgi:NADH:ubiquinone oxidoreductase subunit 3 (subunit A)